MKRGDQVLNVFHGLGRVESVSGKSGRARIHFSPMPPFPYVGSQTTNVSRVGSSEMDMSAPISLIEEETGSWMLKRDAKSRYPGGVLQHMEDLSSISTSSIKPRFTKDRYAAIISKKELRNLKSPAENLVEIVDHIIGGTVQLLVRDAERSRGVVLDTAYMSPHKLRVAASAYLKSGDKKALGAQLLSSISYAKSVELEWLATNVAAIDAMIESRPLRVSMSHLAESMAMRAGWSIALLLADEGCDFTQAIDRTLDR